MQDDEIAVVRQKDLKLCFGFPFADLFFWLFLWSRSLDLVTGMN